MITSCLIFTTDSLHWTLAILSRQGSEVPRMIDALSQSSCYRRRTSYAASPARCDHTGFSRVRATLFGAGLVPCPGIILGGDSGAQSPHGDQCLAGDGVCHGTP